MAERKLFLICRNVDREATVRKAVAATGKLLLAGVFRVAEGAGDIKALLTAARPDAVLIDSSLAADQALQFVAEVRATSPRSVILTAVAEKDFDFLQKAIEAGVKAVIPEPVDYVELPGRIDQLCAENLKAREAASAAAAPAALASRMREAGTQASEIAPVNTPGKGPMTLAFLSSKEGEGKSTVTLNLGLSLAKDFNKRVIYVDLDETLSETAMMLNRKPAGNFLNILKMEDGQFSPYSIQRFAIDYFEDQSFLAICGNPSIVPPKVDQERFDLFLRFLRTQADFVLLDCPVRFGDLLKTSLKIADWHVMVVQNTLSSLRNARIFLEELRRLEYPRHQVRIVLNRVSRSAGLAKEDIAKNIDPYPIVSSIVSNGPVAIEAVTVGMPVLLHAPDSDLTQSIHNFAQALLGIETSDVDDNQVFTIGSMFSNIFGSGR